MNDKQISRTSRPNFEDYATLESYCEGAPVYSLGNITYIYGVNPDLLPGVIMQEENNNPKTKKEVKKCLVRKLLLYFFY